MSAKITRWFELSTFINPRQIRPDQMIFRTRETESKWKQTQPKLVMVTDKKQAKFLGSVKYSLRRVYTREMVECDLGSTNSFRILSVRKSVDTSMERNNEKKMEFIHDPKSKVLQYLADIWSYGKWIPQHHGN